MLVSTKKSLELAKSYTRSTDFIFENIDFRDRGSILLSGSTNPILSRFKEDWNAFSWLDCKIVGFFSKSVKKSVKRGARVLRARSWRTSRALRACESPVSLSVFSLVPDLFFDCSHVLEHATIRTFLQSISWWFVPNYIITELLSRDPYFSKTPLAARTVDRTCWASIRYFHYIARFFFWGLIAKRRPVNIL